MITLAEAQQGLKTHFGFDDFRPGQKPVIESVLAGRDTVVVMPTGGGKSVCYQLPALLRDGATLIVSPLIALMKDQVDALHARNLPATFINSSIDFEEQKRRLHDIKQGRVKMIYVAPERFRSAMFINSLREADITLFAIDEAHCISSWGHDFRPDYLRLKDAIEEIGRPQVIALTATATPYVRADIIEQLALREPNAFVSGFDRPNLAIYVQHTTKEVEKIKLIKTLAARNSHGSGIIYTSTRKTVEQVAHKLQLAGLSATAYHAGMTDGEREARQNSFMRGEVQTIVATNAFGMGIDKPDIRFVVHYQLPGSIEAYYQEIGRAGRDNLDSTCVLLFNYADKRTQDYFIEGSFPPPDLIRRVYETLTAANRDGDGTIYLTAKELAARGAIKNEMAVASALVTLEKAGHIERASDETRTRFVKLLDARPTSRLNINAADIARRAALEQRKLREVINFAYAENCYRSFILNYFGDHDHSESCGTCGNCLKQGGAVKLLPHASSNPQTSHHIDGFVLDTAPFAHDLDDELTRASRIARTRDEAEVRGQELNNQESDDNDFIDIAEARELTEDELLRTRKILACAARMNGRFGKGLLVATLRGSRSQKITGVNLDKLSTYGLLADMGADELNAYVDALIQAGALRVTTGTYPTISISQHGTDVMHERATVSLQLPRAAQINVRRPSTSPSKSYTDIDTTNETYKLYAEGLSIEDIAARRNLTPQTIEAHLEKSIYMNRAFDVSAHVTNDDRKLIEAQIMLLGSERLRPLRDALPEHITYRMIRFVIADIERRTNAAASNTAHAFPTSTN